ncbi:MAG: hypothetical protein PQJ46_17265, partial [Spirochaetales bacterium]|nr:hypothetical protein [Spirochaetales bacterium]
EEQRNLVYIELKKLLNKKSDDGFYSVALHLEGDCRERCLSSYRKMKVALLRMQGITIGIDQYVKTVGDTTRSVLDEVFPHRRGDIYSKSGNKKPAQNDPMVLNKQL